MKTLLALDIGKSRTGVALANSVARIASPLAVITEQDDLVGSVAELVAKESAAGLVVGLPRNLQGGETEQTKYVRTVADEIARSVTVPVYFIDEAVTSKKAEQELESRGKPYDKAEIDMLSAAYILEDFMHEHPEVF